MTSALTSFHLATLFIAATLFAAAAFCDVTTYRIPNSLNAALIALFPFYLFSAPVMPDWRQGFLVFAVVSCFGFAAFLAKAWGAGDVKLLAAASLWAGSEWIATLLLITALVGGIEALFALIALHRDLPPTIRLFRLFRAQIPYGLALATGGMSVLFFIAQPLLLSD
ncbi:MAG: prepilin peptidase [Alphaproteobacteria bacterium]|nr:prepilin peptidase [Alphaproteobacteria bacterium]